MTITEQTAKVPPLERIAVMAREIDQLNQRVEGLVGNQSLDDLLDVVEVAVLGAQFGVSVEAMRRKLQRAGGRVFKLGKCYVIRKIVLLDVMERLEGAHGRHQSPGGKIDQ